MGVDNDTIEKYKRKNENAKVEYLKRIGSWRDGTS